MAENQLSTNQLLYLLIGGKQLKDVIRFVNLTLKLNLTSEAFRAKLGQYRNNPGGFLEENNIIPAGTGSVFNRICKEYSLKDSFYQSKLEDEVMNKVLSNLSKKDLAAAVSALTPKAETPEVNAETTSEG